MKLAHIRWGFGFLLGWQLMTVLYNVVLFRWDWVVFDMACAAVVACSWTLSERSLRSIGGMDRHQKEQIAHYKAMLDMMRREGNEEGERMALDMLAIWGWKGDR